MFDTLKLLGKFSKASKALNENPNLIMELLENPNDFVGCFYIEDEEIVIKIGKKENFNGKL